MLIKNFDSLAKSDARKAILEIAEAGLKAINTELAIKKSVKVVGDKLVVEKEEFPLKKNQKIILVGVGKCALDGLSALQNILDYRVTKGIALDIRKGYISSRVKVLTGTHPLPTKTNVDASKKIVEILGKLDEDDLVIFLISGGGSTLLCLPDEMSCQAEAAILDNLMHSGTDIVHVNTVRKHLSLARGGFLAKYAYPANVVSLIFSDVPTNDIEFIASGPTIKDNTTIQDAAKILAEFDVLEKCGLKNCGLTETPKEDKYFKKVRNILLVSNKLALSAMAERSRELGYESKICTTHLTGEAQSVGNDLAVELHQSSSGKVYLYGGETTVNIRGQGKGGRNQELVLGALSEIKNDEIILSLASDGRDNTDHAGAICDIITKKNAEINKVDPSSYLKNNNSYNFFEKTGDYILTGNTGSNVSDLVIALKNSPS